MDIQSYKPRNYHTHIQLYQYGNNTDIFLIKSIGARILNKEKLIQPGVNCTGVWKIKTIKK